MKYVRPSGGVGVSARLFVADDRGTVAIIVALSMFAIVGMVGLAIDYGRLTSARQELQSITDQALVVAATSAKSGSDYQTAASNYLDTAWQLKKRFGTAQIVVSDAGNNELSGTTTAAISTTFMSILGIKKADMKVNASIVYGQGAVEVALVLDTTGSMSGQPILDLQNATKVLLDTAYTPPGADQKVKVAVVPFAQYVNVGLANRNRSWMSVPNDTTSTSNVCSTSSPIIGTSNCSTRTATAYNDGVPYTYQYQQCDYQYGSPVTTCGPQTYTSTWNGCAGSRAYPLDNQAKVDNSQPVPGVMNVWCGTELLRLTNARSTIDDKIASLTAGGDTYIPAGLLWGWRTLSPDAPFADATPPTAVNAARKVLVLMTDGANTRSPNYPDHEGNDATKADSLMAETCTAIKAQKIALYTIAFNVSDQAAKDRLTACASSPANFFNAPNAAELTAAFQAVGKTLAAIYLKH